MVFSFCLSPNEQRTASECDCVSTGKHAHTLPRPLVASGLCHCIKSARTQPHTRRLRSPTQRPQRTVDQYSQYSTELTKEGQYRPVLTASVSNVFKFIVCFNWGCAGVYAPILPTALSQSSLHMNEVLAGVPVFLYVVVRWRRQGSIFHLDGMHGFEGIWLGQ